MHRDSRTLSRGVAVGVGLLANLGDCLGAVLNFVGVDDGVANGASNVPLVGIGGVLTLLHWLRDTVRVANLLDGLGDAGVVEGGGDASMESLSISLPLANVPVEDTRGTAKSLSIHRDALLNLDGVGGGDALSDVALLGGLGARGGDDLLATLSDGGVLKHIHHSLANLPGSLNSPWDTFLHWGPNTGGGAHMSGNSPSNDADGATDRDGADATTREEQSSSFGLSLGSSGSKASAKKKNGKLHFSAKNLPLSASQ